jgi:hypothetical protein
MSIFPSLRIGAPDVFTSYWSKTVLRRWCFTLAVLVPSLGLSDRLAAQAGVSVTPDAEVFEAAPNSKRGQTFSVTHLAAGSGTYNLVPVCPSGVTNCSVSPTSITVNQNQTGYVLVQFTSGPVGTAPVKLSLIATRTFSPVAVDTGSVIVTQVPLGVTPASAANTAAPDETKKLTWTIPTPRKPVAH